MDINATAQDVEGLIIESPDNALDTWKAEEKAERRTVSDRVLKVLDNLEPSELSIVEASIKIMRFLFCTKQSFSNEGLLTTQSNGIRTCWTKESQGQLRVLKVSSAG